MARLGHITGLYCARLAGVEELLPNENAPLTIWAAIRFLDYMTIWKTFLYRICIATGGEPKWRWGKK
jgi:hypothetical protein